MGKSEPIRFEEYLEKYGDLTYTNVGVSMLPMLRQRRDIMIIRRKEKNERCKKYDVALYIRPPHDYVLHRIVDVTDTGYTFLGDNCYAKEYDIKEEQVIGVLKAFVRNGKKSRDGRIIRNGRMISVDNKLYKVYYHLNYFFYPLRRIRLRARRKAARVVRKLQAMLKK